MLRTLAGTSDIHHIHYFLQYPLVPSDFLRLTQRKGNLTRNPQAPPWHCPCVTLLFTQEEPVSIRNSSEHCALHNTPGVVTWHPALHLQAKYYHTQLNQKPSGALLNHGHISLLQNWTCKLFLHFYKWEEARISIVMYITKSFHCHSRSFSDVCCYHTMANYRASRRRAAKQTQFQGTGAWTLDKFTQQEEL